MIRITESIQIKELRRQHEYRTVALHRLATEAYVAYIRDGDDATYDQAVRKTVLLHRALEREAAALDRAEENNMKTVINSYSEYALNPTESRIARAVRAFQDALSVPDDLVDALVALGQVFAQHLDENGDWVGSELVARRAIADGEETVIAVLDSGLVCEQCWCLAEDRACADCGATATVIDCGHYAQPAEIAVSAHGVVDVCETCEDARNELTDVARWAERRSTNVQIAAAIIELADSDPKIAQRIWEDPTADEQAEVARRVPTGFDVSLQWGDGEVQR